MSLAPTRTSVVFPNPPAPYSPVVIPTVPTRRPASAPATVALQFGRDDRGKPLAVLGEIDDLTACRVMRASVTWRDASSSGISLTSPL